MPLLREDRPWPYRLRVWRHVGDDFHPDVYWFYTYNAAVEMIKIVEGPEGVRSARKWALDWDPKRGNDG